MKELTPFVPLTDRQQEVLEAVACGLSVKEIATALHISHATVSSHINNIKIATGAQKATELSIVWLCRHFDLPVKDLFKKRFTPLFLFLALSLTQIVMPESDKIRTTRSTRIRSRRKTETIY